MLLSEPTPCRKTIGVASPPPASSNPMRPRAVAITAMDAIMAARSGFASSPRHPRLGGDMTSMTVNGEAIHYRIDPDTPLLFALRDASNLTGAKHGCYSGDCGSCTVIVDGRAVLSCQLTIAAAEGADITTIEGLSADRAHPLQQAWAAEQVSQ